MTGQREEVGRNRKETEGGEERKGRWRRRGPQEI